MPLYKKQMSASENWVFANICSKSLIETAQSHAATEKTHLCPFKQHKKGFCFENQIKTLTWLCPSSSSLSSADLAQPVVCLGVSYDGLNSHDGLVDLGLQLPQLLNVQQAQDLGRFVQSCISSVETQDVLV